LDEVAGEALGDQMDQHFAVGLGLEDAPLGFEALPEGRVVFDDAVVDHDEFPGAVVVRVRVDFGRRAVGRPAGVRYADLGRGDLAVGPLGLDLFLELGDLALGLQRLEDAVLQDGDAGRIIAPVFKAAEAVDESLDAVAFAKIADYSTHWDISLGLFRPVRAPCGPSRAGVRFL
jgi:hypothetical protein